MSSRPQTTPAQAPISVLSTEEVVKRLDQSAAPGDVVAFDADGTLWSGDIGVDGFEALLASRGLRPLAGAALNRETSSSGVGTWADANDAARALYEAYQREKYPERSVFEMMAWAFAGYRETEVRAFAAELVEEVGLRARLHPEVLPILTWAADRSVPIFVVSASPRIVVEIAIERLRLPVTRVLGMSAAIEGDILQPRIADPATYGEGKIAALRDGTSNAPLLGAFGDSAYDLPMLGVGKVAVAVRPKPELLARAFVCRHLIELARRDP